MVKFIILPEKNREFFELYLSSFFGLNRYNILRYLTLELILSFSLLNVASRLTVVMLRLDAFYQC